MILWNWIILFLSFFRIGIVGFGGGYAILSMIFMESEKLGITPEQFADLNALDMIIPGPIAINAATYAGYLNSGFTGALAATTGVMLPSFIIIPLVMVFIARYRENRVVSGFLYGIKPAAVGLVAASALIIALDVLLNRGMELSDIFSDPAGTFSLLLVMIFIVTAIANIKFKVNPILLTILAGIAGAIFLNH